MILSIKYLPYRGLCNLVQRRTVASKTIGNNFKEINIPVPWGHVAGKEWGQPGGRPVIAVHGWQDNAGSFDTLIPLLRSDLHVYAIDAPGHGLSSPMPPGILDNMFDKVVTIHQVSLHLALKNFIYLGHSMGGILGYLYSCLFSERVERYVALENLCPVIGPVSSTAALSRFSIESIIELENRGPSIAPSYTLEEATERMVKGYNFSLTPESAKILLKRGSVPSSSGEGYTFSRDLKVKILPITMGVTAETLLYYASLIKCPVLFIKANPGDSHMPVEALKECADLIRKSCGSFQWEDVDGSHHVHLNEPEKVAPIINRFLDS